MTMSGEYRCWDMITMLLLAKTLRTTHDGGSFSNFERNFADTHFMPKTFEKIACHYSTDMSTSPAVSGIVIRCSFITILLLTTSTFSSFVDMLWRPKRASSLRSLWPSLAILHHLLTFLVPRVDQSNATVNILSEFEHIFFNSKKLSNKPNHHIHQTQTINTKWLMISTYVGNMLYKITKKKNKISKIECT